MITLELEEWQLKALRGYFGDNDKTQLEHWAFKVFDDAIKDQEKQIYCPYCGDKKQLIISTDINSEKICKNKLCNN